MPVVSQSIMRPMVPVGASTEAWLLRTPNCSPSSHGRRPSLLGGRRAGRAATSSSSISRRRLLVLAQHPQHVLAVLGEAGERAPCGEAVRAETS